MTSRAIVPVVLLLTLAACQEASQPAAPNEPQEPPRPQLEVRAVYRHATNAVVDYKLFGNGTFQLQYGAWPPYVGTYNRSDSLVSFDFSNGGIPSWCKEAWCRVWLAMGSVRGDTLRVEYDQATTWLLCNDMMDFEVCNSKRALFIRSE